MSTTDPMLRPISAPIPVPGTQQTPTMPTIRSPNFTESSGADSSASANSNVSWKTSGAPQTSMAGTRVSPVSIDRNSSILSSSKGHDNHGNNNQNHYNNNPNSGLRRFPSIGNTKKLTVENATLKAKVTELERYLTGLKEELILAHRQIHAQRLEIKIAEERKAVEFQQLEQHIQKCEYELGAKILECENLQENLQRRRKGTDEHNTGDDKERKIRLLVAENALKEEKIRELLEKADRLGTEVLNLEREKALLMRPPSPPPTLVPSPVVSVTATPKGPTTKITTYNRARKGTGASSLKDLVPITAEAIIAATTPHSTLHKLDSHSRGASAFASNSSSCYQTDSTSPSNSGDTIQSDQRQGLGSPKSEQGFVNSVGYNLTVEHPKLLAKFQALRMQHALASEYLDALESENQELKVQLLDVSGEVQPIPVPATL
ncbi:hypothetical protein EDD21DRAFT_437563 [Dissophora ornata]|nr:hypothetical protein BGZ58_008870 [Dissophora ornata]KAI8604312.1 hypothetical protein EDD21DRAFT_437563 [Dissophora ornata]